MRDNRIIYNTVTIDEETMAASMQPEGLAAVENIFLTLETQFRQLVDQRRGKLSVVMRAVEKQIALLGAAIRAEKARRSHA